MLMRFLSQANCSRWRSATHSRSTTPFLALRMTPGAKSLAIHPTDIWIGVTTILRPSGLQRKLLLGGGGGAELLRSGPPLFQQHFRVLCIVSFWRAIIVPLVRTSSSSRNHRTRLWICGRVRSMQRRVSSATQRPSASRQSSA
jgi:hypothetical protein